MELKEIEQKYSGCWLKDKTAKSALFYIDGVDTEARRVMVQDKSGKSYYVSEDDVPNRFDYTLPKTGFANVDGWSYPFFLMRKAAKQFKRGLHHDNFSCISLPSLVLSRYGARTPELIIKKKAVKVQQGLTINSHKNADAMFFRVFPTFPQALTGMAAGMLGVALTEKWALCRSIYPNFEIDLYRELFRVGHLDTKKKVIYVYSMYFQEMFDYVTRNKVDWTVKLED